MDIIDVLEQIACGKRRLDPKARAELITAANLIRESRGVLADVEWCGKANPPLILRAECPLCEGSIAAGHCPDCKLGNLIDYIRPEGAHA